MKRFFFLLSLLISFSIGQIWAAADVTYDFTGTDWTVSNGTLSNGTVSFTGAGSASKGSFKMNSGYFMLGKKDAYLTFPTYSSAVEKIVVTGKSGASASTKMNIYVETTAVSTETVGSTGTNTYEIASASQAAGTTYTLRVTSDHNAQITKIEIYYAEEVPAGTCATPIFSLDEGTYEGAQSVTISCSTTDATIYYTTDGSTPTTSSSVYSAAIPVAADMTIKAYAVKDGSDDSEVATASYTITEAPDVTLDFTSNTEWKFPNGSSNKKVDRISYTSGDHTIYVAGSTGNGYYFSSSYLLLGKTGAYIELPEFTSSIEKIVVVGTSSGSSGVKFNIYDGTTAVSTEVTGCQNVSQEFVITNPAANKAYKVQVTSNANLQVSKIKIYFGEAPAVAKPTISGDENFVTSTTVTITQTNADAIYYTTNGDAPTKNSTKYTAPFSLTNTATVKAIAVKGNDVSEVASKTFTKVTALTTMAEVQAEAGETEKGINVAISNWVVTAVSGSQVWFTDASNEKGILLYKSGHGFTAGKKLNGTVVGTKIKLYNLYPELTSLVSTEVTVTNADAITPRTTTIAALTNGHPAEQGTVVKLEGLTYSSSSSVLSDGTNTIAADNKFYSSLALIDGTEYDITGVVTYYKDGSNAVVKIAPRSADDVEAQTPVVIPTAANLAALKAAERGTYILTLTNAVISYVNGSNAFIEEGTTGALIYFSSHGYKAGDCLNGDYQVTTADYKGKFEITAMEAQEGATKTTATVPLTTVTIATLNANFASYESRRIKIAGATVTDEISGDDRNGTINDGASLAVYAAVSNKITLTADNNVDIIGYPGYNNANQQLTVWAQADITVNGGETPTPAEGDNVVILAQYDSKYYAMSTTVSNNAFTAIAVEYDGTQVTVKSEAEKTAIQWTKATSENGTTFQDANNKYMKGTDNGAAMSLNTDPCYWSWDATNEYYYIATRSFFYYKDNIFKNYATSNIGKTNNGYSGKAQVIAIAAENIVINSKVSAELAYNPASAEITEGDAWTAPELVNPHSVTISSYSTDNEAVASVTNDGVIALAGGTGTAVITAHFAGDATYLEGDATYTITVNSASPSAGATYHKVTATEDITDGEYLIVYETENVALNGNLTTLDAAQNTVNVVISNNEITGSTEIDAAVFTIDVTNGTLRAHMGDYIGVTSYGNGLKQNANPETYSAHSFSIDGDGNAVISLNNNWTAAMVLNYNKGTSDKRFRYYKSASPQQPIQLYKKDAQPVTKYTVTYAAGGGSGDAPAPVEYEEGETFTVAEADLFTAPEGKEFDTWNDGTNDYAPGATYTVSTADVVLTAKWIDAPQPEELRPNLEQGRLYSACMKRDIIGVQGGILWDISHYEGTKVYFEEIVVSPSAPLTAGRPFILMVTGDFKVSYSGDEISVLPAPSGNSALRGTFSDMDQAAFNTVSWENNDSPIYMLVNNQLRQVADYTHTNLCTGNSLAANRAYLLYSALIEGQPNLAPGRRVMTMSVEENVATDINFSNGETINASKIIRNGQILILRDGKTFDVTGRELR